MNAETTKKERYIEAVGRRKTAVARVRITPAAKASYTMNGKDLAAYFQTTDLQATVTEAFTKSKVPGKYAVSAKIEGGGIASQAEAVRLGISRALIDEDPELRTTVKKLGFLKRDPRAKERRKFGLKKARKSPQWSKR